VWLFLGGWGCWGLRGRRRMGVVRGMCISSMASVLFCLLLPRVFFTEGGMSHMFAPFWVTIWFAGGGVFFVFFAI